MGSNLDSLKNQDLEVSLPKKIRIVSKGNVIEEKLDKVDDHLKRHK